MWRQNQIQTKIINENRKICDDHVESRTLRFTMIGKQCEENKIKCHGREEHRDNIHHWAESLLEFA